MNLQFPRNLVLAFSSLLVVLAGCGVGEYGSVSASGAFSIASSAAAVSTNGQVHYRAQSPSGETASVVWSVTGGDNASSLGEGHIDSNGVYTPPAALSQDRIQVHITASLKGDASETATTSLMVTPGFVQSLRPENASLAAGATLEAMAEIAEVNAGDVRWSVSTDSANSGDKGTLSNQSCVRSLDQYTTCKISYTAPSTPLREMARS